MMIAFAVGAIDLKTGKLNVKAIEDAANNISPDLRRTIALDSFVTSASKKIPPAHSIDKWRDNIINLTDKFNDNDFGQHGTEYRTSANQIAAESKPLLDAIETLKNQYAEIKNEQKKIVSLNTQREDPTASTSVKQEITQKLAKLKQEHEIHVKEFLTAVDKCDKSYQEIIGRLTKLFTTAATLAPSEAAKLTQETPRPE